MLTADKDTRPEEYFVSGRELQRRLDVSADTLRLWRRKGLPYIGGVGIRPRYSLAEVLAWARARGRRTPQGDT